MREKRHFNKLHIPKALQKALPFKNKPKNLEKKGKTPKDQWRPAVIMEPHEKKVIITYPEIRIPYWKMCCLAHF